MGACMAPEESPQSEVVANQKGCFFGWMFEIGGLNLTNE